MICEQEKKMAFRDKHIHQQLDLDGLGHTT